MTTVACDVCGERYEVARSAFGRSQKCMVCLVPFDGCSHTVAPEVDEASADNEAETSQLAAVQRAIGTGLTTLALIGCFGWMASLPFRNPHAIPGRVAAAAPPWSMCRRECPRHGILASHPYRSPRHRTRTPRPRQWYHSLMSVGFQALQHQRRESPTVQWRTPLACQRSAFLRTRQRTPRCRWRVANPVTTVPVRFRLRDAK